MNQKLGRRRRTEQRIAYRNAEAEKRIRAEWDKIADQDNLSDEEALNLVAQNAKVTYGEARDVLCSVWTGEIQRLAYS